MKWYQEKYAKKSLDRAPTYDMVFDLLPKNPLIVETGCVRQEEDYGAGYSTVIFGDYVTTHGGKLITIELSGENLATCKKLTQPYANSIEYIHMDSVMALKEWGHTHPGIMIDLLYLDSWDYPDGDDKADPFPCQNHQRKELAQAWKYLKPGALILLDDNLIGDGGKTRLTKELLRIKGAECLSDGGQQCLYRKI